MQAYLRPGIHVTINLIFQEAELYHICCCPGACPVMPDSAMTETQLTKAGRAVAGNGTHVKVEYTTHNSQGNNTGGNIQYNIMKTCPCNKEIFISSKD